MRVLLVEADMAAARNLAAAFKAGGAVVEISDTGEEALELARHYDYDIIVMELALADIDGFELLRRLRAARLQLPVLVLSAQGHAQAKVKAFALGADDFLSKPFDRAELLARLQAVIRRSKGYAQSTLSVGELRLSLDNHDVSYAGTPIHLTGKEYAILELLMLRKGMVITKESFLNHLYGGMDEPEMKIIDVFVCKLRKKLAQAGAEDVIGTVWGRGYTIRESRDVMAAPALHEEGRPEPAAALSHAA